MKVGQSDGKVTQKFWRLTENDRLIVENNAEQLQIEQRIILLEAVVALIAVIKEK